MGKSIVLLMITALLVSAIGCATTHKSTTHGRSRDNVTISPNKIITKGMAMEQVQMIAGIPSDTTSYRYEEYEIKGGKKAITYAENMPAWYYKTQNGEVEIVFLGGKVSRIQVYEGP